MPPAQFFHSSNHICVLKQNHFCSFIMLQNKPLLDFFYPSVDARATYFTTQDTEQVCQDGYIQKHFHNNIWHCTQTKALFLQDRDQNSKEEKRHLLLFFSSNLSIVDNLQEGRENFLPSPLYSRWGQQLWVFIFTALGAKASSPQGPWEQLSAPQKYCSSCFSLYWLPVSPQLFHLPHALKHPLTPCGFVL